MVFPIFQSCVTSEMRNCSLRRNARTGKYVTGTEYVFRQEEKRRKLHTPMAPLLGSSNSFTITFFISYKKNSSDIMKNISKASATTNQLPVDQDIRANDILLGRGGRTNLHDGNKQFRAIVADHQYEYLVARKKDKILIARRIVSMIKSHGGRFLQQNKDGWVEVSDKRAQAKTSQALRENLDVRNKSLRKKSDYRTKQPLKHKETHQVPEKRRFFLPKRLTTVNDDNMFVPGLVSESFGVTSSGMPLHPLFFQEFIELATEAQV